MLLAAEVQGRRDEEAAARQAQDRAAAATPDAPWPDPYLKEVEEAKVDRRSVLQRAAAGPSEQGNADEAELLYRQLRQDYPGFDAWQDGQRLLNQGDFAGAEKVLRRLARDDPEDVDVRYALGSALLQGNDARGAADCFRQVLQRQPDHAGAYEKLGEALARQGDRAGAIEALRTAVRYLPQRAETQRRLGELLTDDRQDAEALEHLRLALRLDPDDAATKALVERLRRRVAPGP